MLPLLYHLFQGGAGVTGAKSSESMGVGQGTNTLKVQYVLNSHLSNLYTKQIRG